MLKRLYRLVQKSGHILLFVSVCCTENHHPVLKHNQNKWHFYTYQVIIKRYYLTETGFITLMERAYRWLSITWFGSGSNVGSHWRGFRETITFTKLLLVSLGEACLCIPASRPYSQRRQYLCWAEPEADEGVKWEGVWSCLLTWLHTRPAGRGQEGNWTSLGTIAVLKQTQITQIK